MPEAGVSQGLGPWAQLRPRVWLAGCWGRLCWAGSAPCGLLWRGVRTRKEAVEVATSTAMQEGEG